MEAQRENAPAAPLDSAPIERVILVPVALAHGVAAELSALLSRRLAVPCEVGVHTEIVPPPHLGNREQHDADALLRALAALVVPARVVVVGLTALDLAIPVFTHVFGRAVLGGHVALVSTARLGPEFYGAPPDAALTALRTITEVLHELGHVAGLEHCADRGCIMSFVPNVESLDLRGHGFCRRCGERTTARIPLARSVAAP